MSKKLKPTAAEEVFESDGEKFGDIELKPWTPRRIIVAQKLGMIYPALGKQDWSQYQRTKIYAGATNDVIIFIYLSSLEDGDVKFAVYEDAEEFGIQHKLHDVDSPEFAEAYQIFIRTNNQIAASATKPKGSPGNGSEDENHDPND